VRKKWELGAQLKDKLREDTIADASFLRKGSGRGSAALAAGSRAYLKSQPIVTRRSLRMSTRQLNRNCVILSSSKNKEIAQQFLSYFKSPAAADLLVGYGFDVSSRTNK
jgi:ABC-type molybdate transport system substrate-binding protein